MRTYCHFGTGNYHPVTAKIYTDLSMFTADPVLGRDAAQMFNYITSYVEPKHLEAMSISPIGLRQRIERLIEREIENHQAGKTRGHMGKDERAGRRRDDRSPLRCQRGRRAGRPDRARHLLPPAGRAGAFGEYPRALHRRPVPGTQPHLRLRERRSAPLPQCRGVPVIRRPYAA